MAQLPEHLMPVPVTRQRLSREVMAEHQRQRVLDAATAVFAKRGFQGTTVDHIVAAAKIGVGSFYELFAGKSDCFLAAYEQIVAEAYEQIAASIPPAAPWPEQAAAALRVLLELIDASPLQARLALVEVQTAGPEALARHEQTIDAAIPLLARGREASPVADELPLRLEEAILGGFSWYLQQRLVSGEFGSSEERLPEALEIVVEPYLGRDPTAALL